MRKLYITKIENRDAGQYTCIVRVGTFVDEKSVELVLFSEPLFLEELLNVNVHYHHPQDLTVTLTVKFL